MEIVAAIGVSLVVQVIKKWAKPENKLATIGILVAVSLIGAGVYEFLVASGYWETVLKVLVEAAGIYTLIIKQLDK